ncbi:MAG: YARHG domain-containing protein [Saprospiraceae bacterium]|nr:YARHG domain-containing protein [Saprospiraceae bacterium]
MRFSTLFIATLLPILGITQESEEQALGFYFSERDLLEIGVQSEDDYDQLIPLALGERYFKIKFNECENRAYSIDFREEKYFDIFLVGRPCCAGGMCRFESLYTLDKKDSLLSQLQLYSKHFADLGSTRKTISTYHKGLIISIKREEWYDTTLDTLQKRSVQYQYHRVDTLGLITQIPAYKPREHRKYPFTAIRFVTEEELKKHTAAQLAIMRNEIYADYGYNFSSQKWKAYFSELDWYQPKQDNQKVEQSINVLDRINIELISEEENHRKRE